MIKINNFCFLLLICAFCCLSANAQQYGGQADPSRQTYVNTDNQPGGYDYSGQSSASNYGQLQQYAQPGQTYQNQGYINQNQQYQPQQQQYAQQPDYNQQGASSYQVNPQQAQQQQLSQEQLMEQQQAQFKQEAETQQGQVTEQQQKGPSTASRIAKGLAGVAAPLAAGYMMNRIAQRNPYYNQPYGYGGYGYGASPYGYAPSPYGYGYGGYPAPSPYGYGAYPYAQTPAASLGTGIMSGFSNMLMRSSTGY